MNRLSGFAPTALIVMMVLMSGCGYGEGLTEEDRALLEDARDALTSTTTTVHIPTSTTTTVRIPTSTTTTATSTTSAPPPTIATSTTIVDLGPSDECVGAADDLIESIDLAIAFIDGDLLTAEQFVDVVRACGLVHASFGMDLVFDHFVELITDGTARDELAGTSMLGEFCAAFDLDDPTFAQLLSDRAQEICRAIS